MTIKRGATSRGYSLWEKSSTQTMEDYRQLCSDMLDTIHDEIENTHPFNFIKKKSLRREFLEWKQKEDAVIWTLSQTKNSPPIGVTGVTASYLDETETKKLKRMIHGATI